MDSSATSLTLLDCIRDPSNDGAWNLFDGRYRRFVIDFACQLGAQISDAEEAAQRTMAAVWDACRRGHYERQKGRFKNWLLGIARHKIADLCAERTRQPLTPSERSSIDAVLLNVRDPESLSAIWERQWADHVIRQCFDRVREEFSTRDVRIFEQLTVAQESVEQVADGMNVSIKTVYNVKHRVLAHMRRLIHEIDNSL